MPQNISSRVQKHRNALRNAGLHPLQIWVPDTSAKKFKQECHRQSQLIQHDQHEKEILDWISAVSDDEGWV